MPMDKEIMGNAMYDAMIAIIMNQESEPDGELARLRFVAMAGEIIKHISDFATINPMKTTAPANTKRTTGVIE